MGIFSFFKNRKKKTTISYGDDEIVDYKYSQSEIIANKMKDNEPVKVEEISLMISDYFDIKAIEGRLHKFNPTLLKESVFLLEDVTLMVDENDSPKSVKLKLKEHVFNLDLTLIVNAKDFHEVFQPVKLTQLS